MSIKIYFDPRLDIWFATVYDPATNATQTATATDRTAAALAALKGV